MDRKQKSAVVESLVNELNNFNHFYVTDISGLNAEDTSNLRRECHKSDVKLLVVKNSLLKLALDSVEGEFEDIYGVLRKSTSIMFSNTGNLPAKVIKSFAKDNELKKPVLKGAYVEESVYLGPESLEALVSIKSKEELIGDVVALLQSPAKNVISSLQSGGNILSGVLKTLGERE